MALLNLRRVGVRNFRCFGDEEQSGRLAPLTLLVGDNSTGKTSFLAMIRILWNMLSEDAVADFKEEPYDLGSFDEIVHHRGLSDASADSFEAGVILGSDEADESYNFIATFGRGTTAPRFKFSAVWVFGSVGVEGHYVDDELREVRFHTARGSWKLAPEFISARSHSSRFTSQFFYSEVRSLPMYRHQSSLFGDDEERYDPIDGSPPISAEDLDEVGRIRHFRFGLSDFEPYASASGAFEAASYLRPSARFA